MARTRRNLLLGLDAFGTLFTPKKSIAVQYADVARSYGLGGIVENDLDRCFRKAFQKHSNRFPNYGKRSGMNATKWWANVITSTFQCLPSWNEKSPPPELVEAILHRFSSSEGYQLFPDVLPFFKMLRNRASEDTSTVWPWNQTVVGIISNSDDRIIGVLKSFGLTVASLRGTPNLEKSRTNSEGSSDISFMALSYDVGAEKPSRSIFNTAERLAFETIHDLEAGAGADSSLSDWDKVYVGDDINKDVVGALNSGWKAALIQRDLTDEGTTNDRKAMRLMDWSDLGIQPDGPIASRKVPLLNDLRGISRMQILRD
ncbi:hypothetical protein P152DRAFT_396336 [Eremomyces bilateralis CBS 781.70]|uniref:Haloacid dehalogenase n=1 Tax=Eremomyces bilateralis CBS 781.70 TaxID=1392243 RepID=A0A6G1G4Z2_9PEZI|nr:uncharacterized protein P152DRAFT_396336 [Eremomyces bilateralis CBS 781.70]KAF1813088.1 hypothetical protein P152DRAFT_396336 [Eremomyces bilateralis CBS 781.70]